MTNTVKVLFAVDFSANSKMALKRLEYLQEFYEAEFFLIHVLPSFWKDWLASGLYQKEAFQRLQVWQKALIDHYDDTKLFVKYGNPANVILEKAKVIQADLIVLGGRNLEPGGRYRTGATLEAVVRLAQQTVWISHQGEKIKKILCAIDRSPSSAKAIKWSLNIARHLNAALYIVSGLPTPDFNPLGMDHYEVQQQEAHFKKENEAALSEFLAQFDFSGIPVEKKIQWGNPAHLILDTAEDIDADLIVIGAKGHSILHHVFLGDTATTVLRHAPCSLLIVR